MAMYSIRQQNSRKLSYLYAGVVFFLCLETAIAENPPIPPHRPKVMHVSPEYIENLMKSRHSGHSGQEEQNPESITLTETSVQEEMPAPIVVASQKADIDREKLHETTKKEVLEILEGRKMPAVAPAPIVETEEVLPEPKPQANLVADEESGDQQEDFNVESMDEAKMMPAEPANNRTLISFALKPKETKLDDNLVSFLKNRALPLFGSNSEIMMEINSYATENKEEFQSSTRISLARALEVRRWLIENHVPPARVKLRHMGQDSDMKPDDRIDIVLIN